MERMAHWQSAWYMFLDHPWNGLGLGNYPAAYPAYQLLSNFKDPLGHAHNLYLNILAESGVSGLQAIGKPLLAMPHVLGAGIVGAIGEP